jgi:hypothetical protein
MRSESSILSRCGSGFGSRSRSIQDFDDRNLIKITDEKNLNIFNHKLQFTDPYAFTKDIPSYGGNPQHPKESIHYYNKGSRKKV